MVSVISHGRLYNKATPLMLHECTCPKCGCKFRFTNTDIEIDHHYIDTFGRFMRFIECPECNKSIQQFYWEELGEV